LRIGASAYNGLYIGGLLMKKYLMIIVLLISAALVIPFMPIGVPNKIIAECVVLGTLFIIYNTVRKEKDANS
jgi:hypothetical protein